MILPRLKYLIACLGLALMSVLSATAQTNYYPANGTEYPVIGALPGDQVFPDAAIATNGGYVVWQDNITDGDGWGISARRLDATLSGTLGTFRVNQQGAGNQENPRVALLKSGGSVFVWQGGRPSYQHIYARFMTASNLFLTNDIMVNTSSGNFQINPAVATLANGNVVVVWSSFNEARSNSLQDVYGQILSNTGQKVGGEFLINQTTNFNQRSSSVAALANGGFVVTWISEQQRAVAPNLGNNSSYVSTASVYTPSVDVYARLFGGNGAAASSEFLVNSDYSPCASPAVSAAPDGSFMIVWSARDMATADNGYDIFGRAFTGANSGGAIFRVNSHLYGEQYLPRISNLASDYFVTWTSLAQDGSREGVYAQEIHAGGGLVGTEQRVNGTTINQQMHQTIASDGVGQFLIVWTSFTGLASHFDLYAQRYLNAATILQPMSAPYVWAPFVIISNAYQPSLVVSWPPLLGLPVTNYEVYVDGAATPMATVSANQWTMTAANGLTPSSTHFFQVDYLTADGRRSPLSPATSGTNWSGLNYYGIPFEWMQQYYHYNFADWPSNVNAPLTPGGLTLAKVFLSGGNPLDPSTWLATQLFKTPQGLFLSWNPQPGATYQVQVTTNLTTWTDLGVPRFAAGTNDSIYVGGNSAGYYQVKLMR